MLQERLLQYHAAQAPYISLCVTSPRSPYAFSDNRVWIELRGLAGAALTGNSIRLTAGTVKPARYQPHLRRMGTRVVRRFFSGAGSLSAYTSGSSGDSAPSRSHSAACRPAAALPPPPPLEAEAECP